MRNNLTLRARSAAMLAAFIATICIATAGLARPEQQATSPAADPWNASQALRPESLAARIGKSSAAAPPLTVCVGFGTLYREAHIRGAEYHGPASTADGLADLKKWAASQPRNREIVIYCGCCPFVHCPNVRPAFTALQSMGFKAIRVLVLDTGLGQDWVEKGYPTQRHANS